MTSHKLSAHIIMHVLARAHEETHTSTLARTRTVANGMAPHIY